MKSFFAVAAFCTLLTLPARADIYDRINACEASGSQPCIFDLLRELVRSPRGHIPLLSSGHYQNGGGPISVKAGAGFVVLTYPSLEDRANGRYNCEGSHCVNANGHFIDLIDSESFVWGGGPNAYTLIK